MLNKLLNKHEKDQEAVVKRAARKHDDDGHSGAWKVAFADFCLALMCLFLVLWVMAARDKETAEQELRAGGGTSKLDDGNFVKPSAISETAGSLIERFPIPGHGESGPGYPTEAKTRYETKDDLQILSRMLTDLSNQTGLASNLQTVITPFGLRIMLHDTERQGMYVRGSAIPTDRFKELLRRMGPLFARMENQMLIVGHTDSVQYARQETGGFSNWTLSTARAMSARAELLLGGMGKESILQVTGMADRAPLDQQHPTAGINRRIELLILTSNQAQVISSMFGMPGDAQPMSKDADSVLPDIEVLKAMRAKLLPANTSGDAAHASQ